jgi:hypothetical protein
MLVCFTNYYGVEQSIHINPTQVVSVKVIDIGEIHRERKGTYVKVRMVNGERFIVKESLACVVERINLELKK